MTVMNGAGAEVRVGNCLPLSEIPVGTQIHNIELYPERWTVGSFHKQRTADGERRKVRYTGLFQEK